MKKIVLFILSCAVLSGCILFSFHREVHNPRFKGKYPRFSKSLKMRGAHSRYRDCYDVTFNALNIKLGPFKKYVSGKVAITGTAVFDFDTLQVDLFPELKVTAVNHQGKAIRHYRKHGAVMIVMPGKIKTKESFTVEVCYEGEPHVAKKPPWDGGLVWKKDIKQNDWCGVACETQGASLWYPCKDDNSDEADSTSLSFTVPADLFCVSNGQLRAIDSVSSQTERTYKWFVSYPINSYNVTFYLGKYVLLHDVYHSPVTGKDLDLNHYILPWNYSRAKKHFEQLKDFLAFYEKVFGEYPWYRDGFKLVESPYAGMEHQTAIAYGNGYRNDYNGWFDYIILHETAHEWWGNSVSAADLAHVWIHEGFATYTEALYVEHSQGKNAYLDYMFGQRFTILNKRPVVGPMGKKYFSYKDGDVYMKGSWILHTLRTVIADDTLFFDILKTFRMQYNMKQITSEAFVDMVNQKTGKDYNWFFKQYLHKRKAPFLEYYGSEGKIYFRWKYTDDDFKMSVEVVYGNGKKFMIHPTTKVQSVALPNGASDFAFNDRTQLFGKEENKGLMRKAN